MYHQVLKRLLLTAITFTGIAAAAMPDGIQLDEKGTFRFGEAEFFIQVYKAGWSSLTNGNWENRKTSLSDNGLVLTGELNMYGNKGMVSETVKVTGHNNFTLNCSVKFPAPVIIQAIHGALNIPTTTMILTVDDKPVILPAELKEKCVYYNNNAKNMTIKLAGGRTLKVTGSPLKIIIQDNRQYGNTTFSIRFPFTPYEGKIAESSLHLAFSTESAVSQPIDIRSVANRGFADNRSGNSKPGWTGQGKENDLHMIKPGTIDFEALHFKIIDPAKNNGNGTIALGAPIQSGLEESVIVKLPEETTAGALNLLHAAAWLPAGNGPVGKIEVSFADHSTQSISVQARRDIGNWWGPSHYENAWVIWNSENNQAKVGLYASSFPLRNNKPRSVRFQIVNSQALWMIPALTLTDVPIRFAITKEKELKITPGKDWIPLQFKQETVKGSALDFSFLQDAPAGKYGFIQAAPNGELIYENAPDKTIRLYGPNLCFSANFLDKPTVDKLAETFVRLGYNMVRIHHHDSAMLDPKAADSLTLDPDKLDKLDYLFHRMKESGIYLVTDFYTNRIFKPGDNIPECNFYNQAQMKMLAPISKAALDNWKEFTRRWMTHKNPYTGLAWNEDPALFSVNLINEDVLPFKWNLSPKAAQLYIKRFEQWKKENNCPNAQANEGDRYFRKFLQELQKKCLDEQLRYVREDLKMRTMLTSLNYTSLVPLALMRNEFDLVDNHIYFDHPTSLEKPWTAPFKYTQNCAIEQYAQVPRAMMPSRIFGKPFIVTEFNYCFPNRYRAESGPLIGAYSALQNWNGLGRFAWSHGAGKIINPNSPVEGFDTVNDPLAQLSDRIAIMMFRRRDVNPGKQKFSWNVTDDFFEKSDSFEFPQNFQRLGLISQIGSTINGKILENESILKEDNFKSPTRFINNHINTLWNNLLNSKTAVSDTGELRLDTANKTFTVATPRSESITLKSGDLQAGVLSVKKATCFQTVSAISLDDKPIAESSNLLIIHLTSLSNTEAHFGNGKLTVLKHRGKMPLLIYRGQIIVELNTEYPFNISALSADGTTLGKITGKMINGKFSFSADPGGFPGGVMAYHLTR